jgi:hypothetical protein
MSDYGFWARMRDNLRETERDHPKMKNFEHFTFQNERKIPTRNLCRRRDWNAQGNGQKIIN